MTLCMGRAASLQGQLRPPSDKSLTHRALMLGAISRGPCVIDRPLTGEDALATMRCLSALGPTFEWSRADQVKVYPADEWSQPTEPLDCGNSGTTMRLLAGLLASRELDVTLVGDASLSRRPMKRIGEPLRLMGATVEGDTPPLRIRGGALRGIDYTTPVASAQIKSAILLAGLGATGETWVTEPHLSRDHTERMLNALGVPVTRQGLRVGVSAGQPDSFYFTVPADISSAAFFLVAATLLPEAQLELLDVGVNPTRTGVLDVLAQTGMTVVREEERDEMGEPVANLVINRHPAFLQPFTIEGDLVPRLIDEIPVLAVLATQCDGVSRIRDAGELRVKESDRIELVANGLRAMGADVETYPDGMAIQGPVRLKAASIDCHGDHRIGMAFAIAALIADGETRIEGSEAIATSYPSFEKDLWSVLIV